MLIVFGGRPGTGKTTVARLLARRLGAAWLRIDTVEQAILRSGETAFERGAAGYAVAQGLAADNLAVGRTVVADCVNPVAASRQGWAEAAARAGARMVGVHVLCSDPTEHRRRVETRVADIAGHGLPDWEAVRRLNFQPWPDADLTLDTASLCPDRAIDAVEAALRDIAEASA